LEGKTVSKKQFLEQIEVKNPCSEDWERMTGNDKIRFCSHCNLNVRNLSAMTRREALKIVRRSQGRICVRYVQNPVDKTPVFADRLYQITRRAGIAAGVLGASLSFSTLTYAQGNPVLLKRNADSPAEISRENEADKTGGAAASVAGVVTDPEGAVIPNITVVLLDGDKREKRRVASNEEGFYEFKNVAAGNYSIKADGINGFKTLIVENITVSGAENSKLDLQMDIAIETVLTGVVAFDGYEIPLFDAVYKNDAEKVKNLLARGERANLRDENAENITPLFLAVENGNAEIAEILLNFGAKINGKDENKQTPLMRLDDDASPELVRLLLKHGAKVNAADEEGNTPLILAARGADAEVLQVLIDNGALINAQNKEGQTALMNAANEDDLETVKILILAGADVNLKNKQGETAWDLTTDDEVEKLLEMHGGADEKEKEN
jgi:hypothetical protein